MTGILVDPAVNSNLTGSYATKNGLAELAKNGGLLGAQLKAVALTIVLSVVATAVIAFIVKAVVGLRPTTEVESQVWTSANTAKKATSSNYKGSVAAGAHALAAANRSKT
jgi:ammonia channel protein AmtB